jgi:biopolymer transport protein TolR
MKKTRRARRMRKRHLRGFRRHATLNMISLMDIFTILVFFLLVNATSEEVLPSPKHIRLPDSVAEQTPVRNLVIAVDDETLRLQGAMIASVAQAMADPGQKIVALDAALKKAAAGLRNPIEDKGITIMADKDISYALLKRIMLTCAGAGYADLSLAVIQKPREVDS